MATKKDQVPKQLYAVAWVPELELQLSTQIEVLNIGGRIIEENFSKVGAEEVERCLNIGALLRGGEYITIQ